MFQPFGWEDGDQCRKEHSDDGKSDEVNRSGREGVVQPVLRVESRMKLPDSLRQQLVADHVGEQIRAFAD
jgi:hypothetical protein